MRTSLTAPVVVSEPTVRSFGASATNVPVFTVVRTILSAELKSAVAGVVRTSIDKSPIFDVTFAIEPAAKVPISITPPVRVTSPIAELDVSIFSTVIVPVAAIFTNWAATAETPVMSPPASTSTLPVLATKFPNVTSSVAKRSIASITPDAEIVPVDVPVIDPFVAVRSTALSDVMLS